MDDSPVNGPDAKRARLLDDGYYEAPDLYVNFEEGYEIIRDEDGRSKYPQEEDINPTERIMKRVVEYTPKGVLGDLVMSKFLAMGDRRYLEALAGCKAVYDRLAARPEFREDLACFPGTDKRITFDRDIEWVAICDTPLWGYAHVDPLRQLRGGPWTIQLRFEWPVGVNGREVYDQVVSPATVMLHLAKAMAFHFSGRRENAAGKLLKEDTHHYRCVAIILSHMEKAGFLPATLRSDNNARSDEYFGWSEGGPLFEQRRQRNMKSIRQAFEKDANAFFQEVIDSVIRFYDVVDLTSDVASDLMDEFMHSCGLDAMVETLFKFTKSEDGYLRWGRLDLEATARRRELRKSIIELQGRPDFEKWDDHQQAMRDWFMSHREQLLNLALPIVARSVTMSEAAAKRGPIVNQTAFHIYNHRFGYIKPSQLPPFLRHFWALYPAEARAKVEAWEQSLRAETKPSQAKPMMAGDGYPQLIVLHVDDETPSLTFAEELRDIFSSGYVYERVSS